MSIIYRELLNLNNKKPTTWFRKWTKDSNKHFFNKDTQMAYKHRKGYSTALIFGECKSNLQ